MKLTRYDLISRSIFIGYACLLAYWFTALLSAHPLASEDLPAHIALIERLQEQLLSGRIFFYDTAWFGGWPAFQFYGFAAHLFIAIVALPLSLFTENSVLLATHLSLFVALAVLPISISYCATALLNDGLSKYPTLHNPLRIVISVFSCTLAFWFLNHDEQFYGLGAGAALFVGLFSQTFAWHLLLLYLGVLLRAISETRHISLTILVALLIITHPLTAIYAISCGLIIAIWHPRVRKKFLYSHLFGLGLISFWLFPFLALSKHYTLPDPFPAGGDILALVSRYPLPNLIELFSNEGAGAFTKFNIIFIVLPILLLIPFFNREVRRSKLLLTLLVGVIILTVFFSSALITASIPLGLHYYRFQAYAVLTLLCVAAAVPALCSVSRDRKQRSIVINRPMLILWVGLALLGLVSTLQFSTLEQKNADQANKHLPLVAHQKVLDTLKNGGQRVLFEHYNNYRRYPYLASNDLFSQLHAKTSLETLNGLFIESSLAYRMPIATAAKLGADTYHSYLVFSESYDLTREEQIEQLRELGVSQIVVGTEKFRNSLQPFIEKNPTQIGPYTIVKLLGVNSAIAQTTKKTTIGYIDKSGTLPFYFLEFYFYSRSALYKSFDLIDLTEQKNIPPRVTTILLNGKINDNTLKNNAVIQIREPQAQFSHYTRNYQPQRTIIRYQRLAKHLDQHLKLPAPTSLENQQTDSTPEFSWQTKNQSFELANLRKGELIKVNYNYFPLWRCSGGTLYRGSAERMFFLPTAEQAICTYSIRYAPGFWLGCLVSLLSIGGLIFSSIKLRQQQQGHSNLELD